MADAAGDPFALTGIKRIVVSPLDGPGWRLLRASLAATAAAFAVRAVLGIGRLVPEALAALALTAAWAAAARFALLESKAVRLWLVLLAGSAALVAFVGSGPGGWITAVALSFVFLAFRRYRPLARLTHRHRAAAFFLGFAAFQILTWAWFVLPGDELAARAGATGLFARFSRYAIFSLQLFWFFALAHAFFKARLHGTRIRRKLALSTALIVLVPIGVFLVMGSVAVFSLLGESTAARAARIVRDWADQADADPGFFRGLSGTWFRRGQAAERAAGPPAPAWLPGFLKARAGAPGVVPGRTGLFWIGRELWIVRAPGGSPAAGEAAGCLVDEAFMDRLARIIQADVEFTFSNPVRVTRSSRGVTVEAGEGAKEPAWRVSGRVDRSSAEPDTIYAGMTHLEVGAFADGALRPASLLLAVRTGPRFIRRELLSSGNPLSQIVLIGLAVLGVGMLVVEGFVLFFGVRITAGITSAVRALHRGTRRIAAGDLETRIEVPNEDELGDLAASFNEMAAAVKRGREEAAERGRLERELALAREIQERLLPHRMPELPGFEISGASLPSRQVGGDYFDFLDLPDGRLALAIADVSGKGIPAALLMANLQALLRGEAAEGDDVAAVVGRMNNALVRSTDSHMFATFFLAILDRSRAGLVYANAGHNPPFLVRADGAVERLSAGGLVLGFLPGQSYARGAAALGPGDVTVLFTDGLTEAERPGAEGDDRFFGEERLLAVIRDRLGAGAAEIQGAILAAVDAFAGEGPAGDDRTLIVLKRRAA